MNLKEIKVLFNTNLNDLYGKEEVNSFFNITIKHILDFELIDFMTKSEYVVSDEELKNFTSIIKRLKYEEPIQYIIGKTEFNDLDFIVNKHTLIPRPETIDLINWITETAIDTKMEILDIGTGSGCIAISLKKHFEKATVSALDFCENALETASNNAKINNLNVNFYKQDILKTNTLDKKYDIIVSNPPYVRNLEKKEMQNNVLNFEPHTALFVEDNNPLIFYQKITNLAKNYLKNNGLLFFEINEYLAQEMILLLELHNFKNIEVKRDIFGKERMIMGIYKILNN